MPTPRWQKQNHPAGVSSGHSSGKASPGNPPAPGSSGMLQKLLLGFLLNELPSRQAALTSPEACGLLDEEANT